MERLKVAALTSDNRRVMYLHSSMERLKEMIQQFSQQQQPNLHSSMERLKVDTEKYRYRCIEKFTFQYGEIKSNINEWGYFTLFAIYIPVWRD